MTTANARAGFSLMELMIAIMILGIGLVMVATVFPVGLDMSRETIQMDLALGVSNAAVATLQIKVPVYKDMDQSGVFVERVLVPDVLETDADADIQTEDEEPLLGLLTPGSYAGIDQIFALTWGPGWLPLAPNDPAEFFPRVKCFTERTGWAGEMNHWDHTSVVPAQNLPLNYPALIAGATAWSDILTTMIAPAIGSLRANLPRVHLVDQVYPPVPLTKADGSYRDVGDVVGELASRRYSWTAIHHRMSIENKPEVTEWTNRDMFATIVITHRADLTERYARQMDLDPDADIYNVDFNLNTHQTELLQPQPDSDDPDSTDMFFPRPWLVMLNAVNGDTGEILCMDEVARLLPVDSFFVVAATQGNVFVAGTAHKVRTCIWDPSNFGAALDDPLARLEIARGTGGSATDLPVWVFPPAIERIGSAFQFKPRSPVVGVSLRVVKVPK